MSSSTPWLLQLFSEGFKHTQPARLLKETLTDGFVDLVATRQLPMQVLLQDVKYIPAIVERCADLNISGQDLLNMLHRFEIRDRKIILWFVRHFTDEQVKPLFRFILTLATEDIGFVRDSAYLLTDEMFTLSTLGICLSHVLYRLRAKFVLEVGHCFEHDHDCADAVSYTLQKIGTNNRDLASLNEDDSCYALVVPSLLKYQNTGNGVQIVRMWEDLFRLRMWRTIIHVLQTYPDIPQRAGVCPGFAYDTTDSPHETEQMMQILALSHCPSLHVQNSTYGLLALIHVSPLVQEMFFTLPRHKDAILDVAIQTGECEYLDLFVPKNDPSEIIRFLLESHDHTTFPLSTMKALMDKYGNTRKVWSRLCFPATKMLFTLKLVNERLLPSAAALATIAEKVIQFGGPLSLPFLQFIAENYSQTLELNIATIVRCATNDHSTIRWILEEYAPTKLPPASILVIYNNVRMTMLSFRLACAFAKQISLEHQMPMYWIHDESTDIEAAKTDMWMWFAKNQHNPLAVKIIDQFLRKWSSFRDVMTRVLTQTLVDDCVYAFCRSYAWFQTLKQCLVPGEHFIRLHKDTGILCDTMAVVMPEHMIHLQELLQYVLSNDVRTIGRLFQSACYTGNLAFAQYLYHAFKPYIRFQEGFYLRDNIVVHAIANRWVTSKRMKQELYNRVVFFLVEFYYKTLSVAGRKLAA